MKQASPCTHFSNFIYPDSQRMSSPFDTSQLPSCIARLKTSWLYWMDTTEGSRLRTCTQLALLLNHFWPNRNTSISYTINYDAYPSFYEAVFPGFNTTNGNTTLEWSTEGRTFVYEGVNSTYWHVKDQVVAKMTGSQYNRFVSEWLAIVLICFFREDPHPYLN